MPESDFREACEVSIGPAAGDSSVDRDPPAAEPPTSLHAFVLVAVATPVVQSLLGEDREIAAPLSVDFVLQIDDQGRGVVPDARRG